MYTPTADVYGSAPPQQHHGGGQYPPPAVAAAYNHNAYAEHRNHARRSNAPCVNITSTLANVAGALGMIIGACLPILRYSFADGGVVIAFYLYKSTIVIDGETVSGDESLPDGIESPYKTALALLVLGGICALVIGAPLACCNCARRRTGCVRWLRSIVLTLVAVMGVVAYVLVVTARADGDPDSSIFGEGFDWNHSFAGWWLIIVGTVLIAGADLLCIMYMVMSSRLPDPEDAQLQAQFMNNQQYNQRQQQYNATQQPQQMPVIYQGSAPQQMQQYAAYPSPSSPHPGQSHGNPQYIGSGGAIPQQP